MPFVWSVGTIIGPGMYSLPIFFDVKLKNKLMISCSDWRIVGQSIQREPRGFPAVGPVWQVPVSFAQPGLLGFARDQHGLWLVVPL